MSTYPTGFQTDVGGIEKDLADIFEPLGLTTPTTPTGFVGKTGVSTTSDLCNIFKPYSSGTKANPTGFKISGGTDLKDVFQKIGVTPSPPYTISGGSYTQGTFTSGSDTYYYITILPNSSTNTTVTFTQALTSSGTVGTVSGNDLTVICIGGGGGGGGGSIGYRPSVSQYTWATGGGGGGGGIFYAKTSVSTSDYYNVKPGTKGGGGGGANPGGVGSDSYVVLNSTNSANAFVTSLGGGRGTGWYNGDLGGTGSSYSTTLTPASKYTGGSGANGGEGYVYFQNTGLQKTATNGTGSSVTLSVPSGAPSASFILSNYSGGAGGGGGTFSTAGNGGGAGNGSTGGTVGGSSTVSGQNGSVPGSGGGGGGISGASVPSTQNTTGGSGGDGVVIIYFRNP